MQQAQLFEALIQDGYVGGLIEAAIRFVIGKPEVATALIGISDLEQLEQAVEYSNKGALPAAALDRVPWL